MIRKLKTAAIALTLGFGTLATATGGASADSIRVTIGGGDLSVVDYRGGRYERESRWDRHGDRRWDRDRSERASCTPRRAVDKAWRMGLNRPSVESVRRNTIRVSGTQRGYRVNVVFARAANCPVIR